ncbi:hypothetical protein [Escherichia fergusonii]|nr:hypothetical protein [Escherichia fergusonii]
MNEKYLFQRQRELNISYRVVPHPLVTTACYVFCTQMAIRL